MISLFLAVLCSSAIGILFKISEQRASNRYIITTLNYLTAVAFSGYMLMKSGILDLQNDLESVRVIDRFGELFQSNTIQLNFSESFIWSIALGIVTGSFYFISFIYYQINVRKNGIALSGMFSRLGVLVPMFISIIIWSEIPTPVQSFGIVLCLSSIVLVNLNFKRGETFQINSSLVLLFITFGIAILGSKFFQKYALPELKPLFLFCLFLSALLISLTVSLKYIRNVNPWEFVIGISVGIPNMFASWFLIQALGQIKASVVFPVFSAGAIIVMTMIAVFFFNERINTKNGVAIFLTVLALVLINI